MSKGTIDKKRAALYGISALDERHVWAVGAGGVILFGTRSLQTAPW